MLNRLYRVLQAGRINIQYSDYSKSTTTRKASRPKGVEKDVSARPLNLFSVYRDLDL